MVREELLILCMSSICSVLLFTYVQFLAENGSTMTESILVVIGQWYYELQHLHDILCEPITQYFLLRYSEKQGPVNDWVYYQRLACVFLYHIPDIHAFQIRGNLALMKLNSLFFTGTCSATVTGVIFACFRPELLYFENRILKVA